MFETVFGIILAVGVIGLVWMFFKDLMDLFTYFIISFFMFAVLLVASLILMQVASGIMGGLRFSYIEAMPYIILLFLGTFLVCSIKLIHDKQKQRAPKTGRIKRIDTEEVGFAATGQRVLETVNPPADALARTTESGQKQPEDVSESVTGSLDISETPADRAERTTWLDRLSAERWAAAAFQKTPTAPVEQRVTGLDNRADTGTALPVFAGPESQAKPASGDPVAVPAQPKSFLWTNPLTVRSTTIDCGWDVFHVILNRTMEQTTGPVTTSPLLPQLSLLNWETVWEHSCQAGGMGMEERVFSGKTDDAHVFMMVARIPNLKLYDYVSMFRKNMVSAFNFAGDDQFSVTDGHPSWHGAGEIGVENILMFDVRVVQYASSFWSVVTTRSTTNPVADAAMEQLYAALWSTVK